MPRPRSSAPRRAAISPVGRRVVAMGVVLMLAAGMAIGAAVWQLRREAFRQAHQTITNLAAAYAAQTARSIQAVDIVLGAMAERVVSLGADAPERFAALLSDGATHRFLHDRVGLVPQAVDLALVDAGGHSVATARDWPNQPLDLSDRDYVRHFVGTGNTDLYISKPVVSRLTGQWTIYLVRPVMSAGGALAGLVVAAMQVQHFRDLFERITLPEGGTYTLVRQDGVVLTRYPDPVNRSGTVMPEGSAWYAIVAAGGGTYRSPGVFDSAPLEVAVHPIVQYGLVADFVIAETAILADWYREAAVVAGATAVLMFCCTLLLLRLRGQFARLENAQATLLFKNDQLERASKHLRESRAELTAKSRLLHTTLETMDQGLLAVDAQRRVVLCNSRAMELLDLPAELMASQPSYDEVIRRQAEAREFEEAGEDIKALQRAGGLLDEAHTYERRRPNGRVLEVRSVPMQGGGVVRTFADVTGRKQAEDRIRHIAHHDPLTQLANRAHFNEALQDALHAAMRDHHSVAVLYLDLDRFKHVNDSRGHAVGDSLLAEVARRLRGAVRGSDCVARMGGDEFAIVQPNADRPDGTTALASRLVQLVAEPYLIDGEACEVGVSIGIAFYPEDGLSAEDILRHADSALYSAKHGGRNTFRCYRQLAAEPMEDTGADLNASLGS